MLFRFLLIVLLGLVLIIIVISHHRRRHQRAVIIVGPKFGFARCVGVAARFISHPDCHLLLGGGFLFLCRFLFASSFLSMIMMSRRRSFVPTAAAFQPLPMKLRRRRRRRRSCFIVVAMSFRKERRFHDQSRRRRRRRACVRFIKSSNQSLRHGRSFDAHERRSSRFFGGRSTQYLAVGNDDRIIISSSRSSSRILEKVLLELGFGKRSRNVLDANSCCCRCRCRCRRVLLMLLSNKIRGGRG
jgi:hypothetical protein